MSYTCGLFRKFTALSVSLLVYFTGVVSAYALDDSRALLEEFAGYQDAYQLAYKTDLNENGVGEYASLSSLKPQTVGLFQSLEEQGHALETITFQNGLVVAQLRPLIDATVLSANRGAKTPPVLDVQDRVRATEWGYWLFCFTASTKIRSFVAINDRKAIVRVELPKEAASIKDALALVYPDYGDVSNYNRAIADRHYVKVAPPAPK